MEEARIKANGIEFAYLEQGQGGARTPIGRSKAAATSFIVNGLPKSAKPY